MNNILKKENMKWPVTLTNIPRESWLVDGQKTRVGVLRPREFLVQVYREPPGYRLSINRTLINGDGRWKDGISWDDLQRLKREAGYGEYDAVEIYPCDSDIVNVANMRHLFVLEAGTIISYKWKNPKKP